MKLAVTDRLSVADLRSDVLVRIPDRRFTDNVLKVRPLRPFRPRMLARSQLTVPVAPNPTPSDADVFESPDGSARFVLPRYAMAFDNHVGGTEEPRIAIADRNGTAALLVSFIETPSPAAAADRAELVHVPSVSLTYQMPVSGGGVAPQRIVFAATALDAAQTTLSAELLLETGQREHLLAVLGDLSTCATFTVHRSITVGVPTGANLPDGTPGYALRQLVLDCAAKPAPLVLSDAQRTRLGGGSGGVQPLVRHRIAFGSTSHSYWQDPARPSRFAFLPDRFSLARATDGNRKPLLRVFAAAPSAGTDEAPRIAFEFIARPVLDGDRLEAARPQLEQAAQSLGGSGPVVLEMLHDPQPMLRLALPHNGAPSFAMTERPDADVDLEAGLAHVETMGLADFQLVYQALLGASLTLLRGEVRTVSGGDPQDVPLELRIDDTVGEVLEFSVGSATAQGFGWRAVNVIESPVRIDHLAAAAVVGDRRVALRIDGLTAGQRLAPGAGVDLVLVPAEPLAALPAEAVDFDTAGVVVEPDAPAIWNAVFDRSAAAQMPRRIAVEAVPLMFASADRPDDRVAAFVVTVEHGGTVRLTETELRAETTVQVPIEPLITGAPMPPIRYRTETWWGSGGIGVSAWRDAPGTILFAVKTAPS